MIFRRIIQQICAFTVVTCALAVPTLAQAERGPSTAEENARVVALASASDKDPIGTMSSADGRWFMKWADEVADYSFGPDAGTFWLETGAAKGEMARVVRFHHTVSTAAYQVQHAMFDPQRKKEDMEAKTLAGVEGLLRAYESLLAKRPENRSQAMDDAIALRDKGGLADFVKKLPAMPRR
jgi:carboxypeptidase Q